MDHWSNVTLPFYITPRLMLVHFWGFMGLRRVIRGFISTRGLFEVHTLVEIKNAMRRLNCRNQNLLTVWDIFWKIVLSVRTYLHQALRLLISTDWNFICTRDTVVDKWKWGSKVYQIFLNIFFTITNGGDIFYMLQYTILWQKKLFLNKIHTMVQFSNALGTKIDAVNQNH